MSQLLLTELPQVGPFISNHSIPHIIVLIIVIVPHIIVVIVRYHCTSSSLSDIILPHIIVLIIVINDTCQVVKSLDFEGG